jgi:hypothetical protein
MSLRDCEVPVFEFWLIRKGNITEVAEGPEDTEKECPAIAVHPSYVYRRLVVLRDLGDIAFRAAWQTGRILAQCTWPMTGRTSR